MPLLITLVLTLSTWYFAVKKPTSAIALTIISIPTFLFRWHVGALSFNTLDLIIAGSFVLFFLTHLYELRETLMRHRIPCILLSLWFIAAVIAMVVSPDITLALGILKSYFILPVLFTFMLLSIARSKNNIVTVLSVFALLAILVSGVAVLQWFFPEGVSVGGARWFTIPKPIWRAPETFRVTSFLEYPNAVGLLLAPLVPFFIALYTLSQKKFLKILALIAIVASIVAIFLAKSKGAILALLVAGVIWCFMRFRKGSLIITIILGLIFILFPPSLSPLISKMGPGSYSAQLRTQQWKETIELLKDSPIIGAGLAGFQERITPYHTRDYIEVFLYPHNIILNFWVELGLLGLIVFVALILYNFAKNISMLRRNGMKSISGHLALLGMLSMLIIIIHGIVDVPYFKNDLAVLFFFVWSWPILIANISAKGGSASGGKNQIAK